MMHFNNVINGFKCPLTLMAMLTEKRGLGLMQPTLDDVKHCDWLIDIQSNKLVHSHRVI